MNRPGPTHIDPGEAPGGLVFHLYNETGRLLAVDAVLPPGRRPSQAVTVAADTAPGPVVLVAYDGDTGRRLTAEDLQHAGLHPGQRL